jgi:cytochrome c peroxidase
MGALGAIFWTALAGCAGESTSDEPAERDAAPLERGLEPISPLPTEVDLDPRRVALGERLFADPVVSGDGRISCIGCHPLRHGGADGLPLSERPGRGPGKLNTPTIFNVSYSWRLNWTAKFDALEEQLDGPMKNPDIMGTDWAKLLERLRARSDYVRRFAQTYDDGLTEGNCRDALASYERSLVTPNAKFDRFLRGEATLEPDEAAGWRVFREYGCVSCHQGINIGGNMLQRFGVMRDPFLRQPDMQLFLGRTETREADLGRFGVTHDAEDRFVFRVPSLRNVALTAPYFHDGSATTLEDAITVMGEVQLGRELGPDRVRALAAFLESLTGEYRGVPL